MRLQAAIAVLVASSVLAAATGRAQSDSPARLPRFEGTLRDAVKSSIDRGLGYLRWSQQQNGSWDDDPEVTALALRTFFESHRAYVPADGPFIRNPLAFLTGRVGRDGSVPRGGVGGPEYASAVTLLALSHALPSTDEALRSNTRFVRSTISSAPASVRSRMDIHVLAVMMEALQAVDVPRTHDVWEVAVPLIDQAVSELPAEPLPRAGQVAIGLHALLLAGVDRGDPRIQTTAAQIRRDYRIPKDGEHSEPGLYHYFYGVTKALHALGDPTLVDADGMTHDWRTEIATALIARQHDPDAYWAGHADYRSEDSRRRSTSLALYALELIYN